MRVLFDQGVPVPLRESLTQHEVSTAYERGWSKLENGELLDAAEQDGFEVFVTTDKNLRHQQYLGARRIATVVLTSTSWLRIQNDIAAVVRAVHLPKLDGQRVGWAKARRPYPSCLMIS